MGVTTTKSLDGPGGIFVSADSYVDLAAWHRTADELRANDPVHRVEIDGFVPFYALTRHADVFEIERQPERFLNTLQSVLFKSIFYQKQAESCLLYTSDAADE